MSETVENFVTSLIQTQNDDQCLALLKELFKDKGLLALPKLPEAANGTLGYISSYIPNAHNVPLLNKLPGLNMIVSKPPTDVVDEPIAVSNDTVDPLVIEELARYVYKDSKNTLETGMTNIPIGILLMKFGCIKCFKYLLQKKVISVDALVDFHSKNKLHWSDLNYCHYAVLNNHVEFLEAILAAAKEQNKSVLDYNGKVKAGEYQFLMPTANAVHLAAIAGTKIECFEHLQKYGANFNKGDGRGNTPLHMAVLAGNEYAVNTLLDPKFKIVSAEKGANQPTLNDAGDDPLRIAMMKGVIGLIKPFIDKHFASDQPNPYDESNPIQLALAWDEQFFDNPRAKAKMISPLFGPHLKSEVLASISHRQKFFKMAYTQSVHQLDIKLKRYPERKGWEKLIITHRSRREYKEYIDVAITQVQDKYSRTMPVTLFGNLAATPCPNPEAAFFAITSAVQSIRQRMRDENHFGWRGVNGSQMHAILLASEKKMIAYQEIGAFTDDSKILHAHVNALVRLHINEYQREIRQRWFHPHRSRYEIIEQLQNALTEMPSATPAAAQEYIVKIQKQIDASLETITPRCCGFLRRIHKSSMYQHCHQLQTQLKRLQNITNNKLNIDWNEVEHIRSSMQAIEQMQALETIEAAKRQSKSKKVTPMGASTTSS